MKQKKDRITYFKNLFKSKFDFNNDPNQFLKDARNFKRIEDEYKEKFNDSLRSVKVAILGTYTTSFIIDGLRLYLFKYGISPEFYEAPYDSIEAEILNENSGLYEFKPDMVLLLTDYRSIKMFPPLFSTDEDIKTWVMEKGRTFDSLWGQIGAKLKCQVFQTNFALPVHREVGNLEASLPFSKTCVLQDLNRHLALNKSSNVTIIDLDYLSSIFGKKRWFDSKNYNISKQGVSFEALSEACSYISKLIVNSLGLVEKCLVLDLDNTLWGGVIGDDGLDGVSLSQNDPTGESFWNFQQYVKNLQLRGVVLAVCSKNEEEVAKKMFTDHPDMILKPEDISVFIANWDDKASNIKLIAEKLNIGLDSLVFFDDNPAEREIVREFLPMVNVIDVPEDPSLYVDALNDSQCFQWLQLTKEDISRNDSYRQDEARKELSSRAVDYKSFLKSLKMSGVLSYIQAEDFPRFTQLINKSNQFNLRTIRYSESQIAEMNADKKNHRLYSMNFSDKFSKYGIMSCLIVKKEKDVAYIDTWVMSCRVLNRGIEDAIINHLASDLNDWGCRKIIGEYIPTKKNKLVMNLYPNLGFKKYDSDDRANSKISSYALDISNNYKEREHYIQL